MSAPDGASRSGAPLRIRKGAASDLALTWGLGCSADAMSAGTGVMDTELDEFTEDALESAGESGGDAAAMVTATG